MLIITKCNFSPMWHSKGKEVDVAEKSMSFKHWEYYQYFEAVKPYYHWPVLVAVALKYSFCNSNSEC